ncbi:hypothetical protein FQR65_LT12508 [Abscondita terminalis]|nr:hypothetical protein FQR65_LT12508 [Abscondita terminalis]
MNSTWKKYLVYFAQEHVNFRFAEIESLLSLFHIPVKFLEKPTDLQPYWIVEFNKEEDVKLLASRSLSIRYCLELWGNARNLDELHQNIKALPSSFVEDHLLPNKTFKIAVQSFCKHLTQADKVKRIQTFSYLPFKGQVNLNNPDTHLLYLEYYGTDSNDPPEKPYSVFFGRWITAGFRQLIRELSLKTRKFIGNTSMDPQLSLLMANQAQVKQGDFVLDPFVGSGSLLVAAAYFGGYVIGSDIDYLMLHGKSRPSRIKMKKRDENESIKANMEQYGLQDKYMDVLVNDFSTPFFRENIRFDSIITDPPYGIREATEKVGIHKENYTIEERHLPTHIPAKVEYQFSKLYQDLLAFSAKHLRRGGRLVCWFPIFRDDYSEEGLPSHPCMNLVANSEQVLSKYTSRRLLTFEKLEEPTHGQCDGANTIADFRNKYYSSRSETTRRERRTKEACIREQHRLDALERKKNVDS